MPINCRVIESAQSTIEDSPAIHLLERVIIKKSKSAKRMTEIFGMRRQSAAARALWITVEDSELRKIQSGVALTLATAALQICRPLRGLNSRASSCQL
jgi:hypothetical protein